MRLTVSDRLLRRELGVRTQYSSVSGLYGDHEFVQDLDIVNELEGHSGCVNALRSAIHCATLHSNANNDTVGHVRVGYWHLDPMTEWSTYTPIIRRTLGHSFLWRQLSTHHIRPIFSPSSSCHILMITPSSPAQETKKFESLILNVQRNLVAAPPTSPPIQQTQKSSDLMTRQ